MTEWVAIANGALDVRAVGTDTAGASIIVLGTEPSEPIGLVAPFAELWEQLVRGPVDSSVLTPEAESVVLEFEAAGLASRQADHPARISGVEPPWLSSPMHELVYALIASVARRLSIDFVAIKGPMLHKQGLRDREHSGDVDVWMETGRIAEFAEALQPWGWSVAPGLWGDAPSYHSTTLVQDSWGCEIDLHRHMPGCAVSDSEALQTLGSCSEYWQFAGVPALVPEPGAHAVIAALHLTRPLQGRVPSIGLINDANRVLTTAGTSSLQFANRIRASAALDAVLQDAFPDDYTPASYQPPLNWRWRSEKNPIKRVILSLKLVPFNMRLRVLRSVLWPDDDFAMRSDKTSGERSRSPFAARVRRLMRGLKKSRR